MTAVLPAVDVLRRDAGMSSLDDDQLNYVSPTDWKTKYYEVADMLAETRAELDEFHTSSKELEEELIKEIERTEKAQQDLKVKVSRVETERDEWKSKFMSLQTTHNTTTTSLQRELDTARQESQRLKVQLRELEMGNDDLERNERAVSSTLADVETKYSRVLEEKILLEHELLDKANLEEECQRLKDELRDTGLEMSILKDQLSAARSNLPRSLSEISPSEGLSSSSSALTEESLLDTPPPPDINLSELSVDTSSISTPSRPPSPSIQPTLLQRARFQPGKFSTSISTPPVTRSSALPTLSASRTLTPRTPIPRPNLVASSSTTTSSAIPITVAKSKGVQMVSEMRARVRNLEQKIHTRVPRLRMGSNAGRQGPNLLALSVITPPPNNAATSIVSKGGFPQTTTLDTKLAGANFQRHSTDASPLKSGATTPDPNRSGWVLIMDDTPSPAKDTEKERRRVSSPSVPVSFRSGIPTSASSPTFFRPDSLGHSTMNSRRPQSRLSGESQSTTATISTIPTPSSRPTTPTFLPIPVSNLYGSGPISGIGMKRSTGPGAAAKIQQKRDSLGSSNAGSPTSSENEARACERPVSYNGKLDRQTSKALPHFLPPDANVTIRASSRIPSSAASTSILTQSRIGRPAGVTSGRRSVGLDVPPREGGEPRADTKDRGRSGSTAMSFGR